jgi:hypothetical protein
VSVLRDKFSAIHPRLTGELRSRTNIKRSANTGANAGTSDTELQRQLTSAGVSDAGFYWNQKSWFAPGQPHAKGQEMRSNTAGPFFSATRISASIAACQFLRVLFGFWKRDDVFTGLS